MPRVRIRNKRTGREKAVPERAAHHFVQTQRWEYADAEVTAAPTPQPKPAPEPVQVDADADLEDLSYNDLRRLASQMGVNPEGRKAEDYIAAIEEERDASRGYDTRALHPED